MVYVAPFLIFSYNMLLLLWPRDEEEEEERMNTTYYHYNNYNSTGMMWQSYVGLEGAAALLLVFYALAGRSVTDQPKKS